ncbi:MAG TPA: DUF4336 domain-containing protein [Nannocystis exedens]|nr:DUF4336 domain-containing protein [Nannocystis exedens]
MLRDSAPRALVEFVPDRIWISDYDVRFMGMTIEARTTVVRLGDRGLWIHSPGPVDDAMAAQLHALGPVEQIVAPGTFHTLFVRSFQGRYPNASVWVCPGIETKFPELTYDHILDDHDAPPAWSGQIDQALVRGARMIREVAFFHRDSRTLILTDLLENLGDASGPLDWKLRLYWKHIFHMWNHPKPAPEYQMSTRDKALMRRCLERVLAWDFERVIIAHGEHITQDARQVVLDAWSKPLSYEGR